MTKNTKITVIHESKKDNVPNLLEHCHNNLSKEQINELSKKAAEEMLNLQIKAQSYKLDNYKVEMDIRNHIDTFSRLEKNKSDMTTGHSVNSEIKTHNSNIKINSRTGSQCFVATATYDNIDHKNVVFLRRWRDNVLLKYYFGKKFIDLYWIIGPKLAKYVSNNKFFKEISKIILSTLIFCIKLLYK